MGKNLAKDMSREELDQMRALWSDAPSIVAIIDMALRGLDAADERDRYRVLLEESKPRLVALYENDKVRRLCERIDAALEGKTND